MTATDPAAKLPVRTKLAYGLGTAAFGIKDHGFNVLLMLFYNQVVGLPAAWVGTAIMLAMLVDAVMDPLIGHSSDNFRSRWGRRHPFMYGSALPIAAAYFLLWSPPQASPEVLFAYLLGTSIVVRVAISCYEIPAAALMTEFTWDYNERTSLSTYRSLFLALGMIVMSVLVFKVFLQPTAEQSVGQLNAAGYARYGLVAALVMFSCIFVSTWGTHHRIPSLHVAKEAEHIGLRSLLAGLKIVMFDRAYASLLLCAFFFAIVTGMSTTLGVYISTYYWKLGPDQLGRIAASAVWSLILALVVVQLSKKLGKKPTAITLYGIALAAITLPVSLGLLGIMPRDLDALMPWLILQAVFVIMCVLAALILVTSMVADVGEHFELKTGRRMEGLMFASLIMINKGVSGMGVFLSGLILSAVHFPEKATPGSVDPQIINHLALIYVLSLGVFCVAALVALTFYPITREVHERTLKALGKA